MSARAPAQYDADWLDRLLDRAIADTELLSDRDMEFVCGTVERWNRWGADTRLSAKQLKWLEDIERKLDAGGAPADPDDPDDAVARPVDEVLR